ncbi:glucose dehydrogenase [FAD, quinone]-like [Cimex lectularius]|uniref:Glucose-methanol-choline oxidoreductase N-terminal domain-containing protein n=1 Tax=Cimex lectularius TaxID=79782 RepID=A0A8I6TEX4_CIMLE|nr:glucose dehydrogenase [FAD, quinone]-like [Cimex lectularius]
MFCLKWILFFCVFEISTGQFQSVLNYYREILNIPQGATRDTDVFKKEYDFIVVGAGSGGSVVANRLTEVGNWSVLLLEAGKEEILITDIPLLVSYILGTEFNWGYTTEPQQFGCLSMNSGRCNWPRGKAMGGTSVINYMVYTRGFKEDYDNWASLGNTGWGYKDVFKYFLKSENIRVPGLEKSRFHKKGGYANVERPSWRTPLAKSFMESGESLGYPTGDNDGLTPPGFSYVLTTTKRGARESASKAFLRPIRNRPNLHVVKKARATKILIDPTSKKTYGVEFVKNRKYYKVKASKEVIVSAGSLNTPQLLMLSGIGPKSHLEELNIPVLKDSKVGHNLQDHVSMAGLAFLVNDTVSIVENRYMNPRYVLDYWVRGEGPYTLPGGAEAVAFVSTKNNPNKTHPDMELVFGPGAFTGDTGGSIRMSYAMNETFFDRVYRRYQGKDAFNVVPVLLRPYSRGYLRLRSKNPFHWPLFYPNYYTDPRDIDAMVDGIKKALEIGLSKPFQKFNSKLIDSKFPGCEHLEYMSDEYWGCCAMHLTTNLHHQVGTCKMGPNNDPDAVVDPQLRVYGVQGLRVVDGSIMPVIPASHTHAVIYMIAEKASDMIKQAWRGK